MRAAFVVSAVLLLAGPPGISEADECLITTIYGDTFIAGILEDGSEVVALQLPDGSRCDMWSWQIASIEHETRAGREHMSLVMRIPSIRGDVFGFRGKYYQQGGFACLPLMSALVASEPTDTRLRRLAGEYRVKTIAGVAVELAAVTALSVGVAYVVVSASHGDATGACIGLFGALIVPGILDTVARVSLRPEPGGVVSYYNEAYGTR